MTPCPALHIWLIGTLHNFLQGRGAIVFGTALQAPPASQRFPYATALLGVTTTTAADAFTIVT